MIKKIGTLVLCLLLCGCSRPVELKKQTFTIELGQDVYANPALYVKEQTGRDLQSLEVSPISIGIVKTKNRFVSMGYDYLLVGEYDFEIQRNKDSFPFRVKIKDTKPPTLLSNPTEIDVVQGEVVDWSTHIAAEDLSGVEYSSTQDYFPYIGEHYVEVSVSDHFGNSNEVNIKVVVK